MPDTQTFTSSANGIELVIPGLASGGGAAIGVLLGKPRTTRQHIADVGSMVLGGILVAPTVCTETGVSSVQDVCAVSAAMGFVGPVLLRAVVSIIDEIGKQVEDSKSDTAKTVLTIANRMFLGRIARWIRTPDPETVHTLLVQPPPPSPPVLIISQASPVAPSAPAQNSVGVPPPTVISPAG